MRLNIGNLRLWLFRVLVAVAAGLMVRSFIMPWWSANIIPPGAVVSPGSIQIYGYGLRHSLVELAEYIAADETPLYQTILAWIYLAASVGLILFSTWLKGIKGRWLLGGIGLIYIAYAAIAVFVVIANRTADFGISLQGWSTITAQGQTGSILTSLKPAYYLAHAAGVMCIALALLRNKIIGRPKSGA